ncbi:Uncharacterized membrane protein YkvA, DUF1232 family [Peptoclostridium litorale DSM 5388]|uniref:DUF1232 domain-containing protein n=1 Tax=Peptoclostridium litorale DSM 5388 TaxID=1121324 RepID=A0A069RKT0_PEPLI|nr:YkvA family protein [Peptoclostridium litorale]KDR96735.1 hypothetical protein CLIT_2c03410 [Peptoclostridium litorale DSM 5388]SIN67317.1 Uncharacterized membrane protein YkvA, DUF1232 family [Peptoclostridium litorale DSM 5388]
MEKKDVEKEYAKYRRRASQYANDREKSKELLAVAMKKAIKSRNGALEEVWGNLVLLFEMFRDWISGKYNSVPMNSIIMIIGALLYFVAPMDVIPDFIMGMGIVDDAAVISILIKKISSDIEKYKAWKEIADETTKRD